MATDVTLPELGENITRATVLDVLVAAGDEVTKDQALLTLESDKALAVELKQGEEYRGADINVSPVRAFHVRGIVSNLPQQNAAGTRGAAPAPPAPFPGFGGGGGGRGGDRRS